MIGEGVEGVDSGVKVFWQPHPRQFLLKLLPCQPVEHQDEDTGRGSFLLH